MPGGGTPFCPGFCGTQTGNPRVDSGRRRCFGLPLSVRTSILIPLFHGWTDWYTKGMERGRNSILSAGGGLGVVALILMSSASTADDGVEFFERRVRPLLAKRCFSCHGPKKQEGGLRRDIRGGATKGGESGPSRVTGKPKQSLMITAVRRTG